METLTRLVSESLARHGYDRPLDYRRLRWSRWFRCESHHSLLSVPSKPGVFALAEEITHVAPVHGAQTSQVATAAEPVLSEAKGSGLNSKAESPEAEGREPEAPRRMLAVTEFFEDDDMAFVLDRMLSQHNPMRARLSSGRFFVRFVVIEDQPQRRSICSALNQWIASSAERVTGIGAHFASSLELTEHNLSVNTAGVAMATTARVATAAKPALSEVEGAVPRSRSGAAPTTPPDAMQRHSTTAPQLDSGAASNIHCPSPFPSGF